MMKIIAKITSATVCPPHTSLFVGRPTEERAHFTFMARKKQSGSKKVKCQGMILRKEKPE